MQLADSSTTETDGENAIHLLNVGSRIDLEIGCLALERRDDCGERKLMMSGQKGVEDFC